MNLRAFSIRFRFKFSLASRSLWLMPSCSVMQLIIFSVSSFVGNAVINAIRELTGIESYIDGINDLYVDGKKICGILLESGSEFDSGTLQWIVAGIGINFDSDINSFPEDVKERASSLFTAGKATITKNKLIARIIEKIL